MDKKEFRVYCEKVRIMNANVPDWYDKSSSIIGDYLRQSTSYGYGKVLEQLLAPAYKILVKSIVEEKFTGGSGELYELASLLSVTVRIDEYRFSAYYFAICLAAAGFFNVAIDDSDCESFDENELIKFDSTVSIQEEVDQQKKQLKKFSLRLLDFSRTNQLVHFRPIKSATMSLLSGDVLKTLRQIGGKNTKIYLAGWSKLHPKIIYKCKLCGRVEFHRYDFGAKKMQSATDCPICDANNTHNRKSMVPLKERLICLSNDVYTCSCGKKLTINELESSALVCPQCKKNIDLESSPVISRSALKNYNSDELVSAVNDAIANDVARTVLNKAKNMERNFGLHVLYLACGFLKWKDTNGTIYNSPILLCPINLGIDKAKGQYYFEVDQSAEATFEVNKTLIQMLASYSKTCSILLPPLDTKNIGAYFSLIRQTFQNNGYRIFEITKDWEIDAGFGIGLFHYQKLQLQHDIETNRDIYLRHPIIRRLCGDENVEISISTPQQRHKTEYMLLDADSSQEEVIKASQEGKSFILQGPPGSGKSQTITNIISSALGEGKTVLFVTEKTSARSVIIDNLLKCNVDGDKKLTDFILDFDSFKKRSGAVSRSPFVAELNRCLMRYNPIGGYDDQLIADEALRYGQIKKFMEQVRGEYDGRNYLRLLQDMAQFSAFEALGETQQIPVDRVEFTELCDSIGRYYTAIKNCGGVFDYSKHSLYGCKGDSSPTLFKIASEYKAMYDALTEVISELANYGWKVEYSLSDLQECVKMLRLWSGMPRLSEEILKNLSEKKINDILEWAKARKDTTIRLENHEGKKYSSSVDYIKYRTFDIKKAKIQSKTYHSIFMRLGRKYLAWKDGIFACFRTVPYKRNYKASMDALKQLEQYSEYLQLKSVNEQQESEDTKVLGYEPQRENDWVELINSLNIVLSILSSHNMQVLDLKYVADWALRFAPLQYSATINHLQTLERRLVKVISDEQSLGNQLGVFIESPCKDFLAYRFMAENIINHQTILADWHSLVMIVAQIEQAGWGFVLNELIDSNEVDFEIAKARLFKSYYQKLVREFVDTNALDCIRNFSRTEQEKLLASYAEADKRMLNTGAKRLYEKLNMYLRRAASVKAKGVEGEYPKLQSKANHSIKQIILENWEYIKHIRPCFMMSPLNTSQYIDVSLQFDLVIFDEASQIFTEDALASIVRGKQIIIAGDSKQLPPCDFFRAGESMQDDDEQYYEEEANIENSLLTSADKALDDASISLAWHYRSCDEALIAFSNKEMEYNLISFPSARRNPNDGIVYVPVSYTPYSCYVAGKSGTHINPGEADRIVELIYEEMIHPERKMFSIGVVAFSNAQAYEIESRWEIFKQRTDKKVAIEQWEKMHEEEPLIFCNLDTVQGDERDTTIISICYSPDSSGKFTLPYLGRIRLLSGMKRINVAVTRAKHRMVVVSTLKSSQLKAAMQTSSAPSENKAGAEMLCNFLEYAQMFTRDQKVFSGITYNPFVIDICRVLDEIGVAYDTEIGRSECKINIGIRKINEEGCYVLGIIVDDPRRTDFDSVREYARLTEQVLSQKYGWNIYRIYPTAWINDYEREKQNLIDAVRSANPT